MKIETKLDPRQEAWVMTSEGIKSGKVNTISYFNYRGKEEIRYGISGIDDHVYEPYVYATKKELQDSL